MNYRDAVEKTLSSLTLSDKDLAAATLARGYAEALDCWEEDLSKLGPKLLQVLTALGATPASRREKGGKADVTEFPDRLTLLLGEG